MEENNREQLEQINQMGHANEPTGSPAEDLTVSNGDQLLTNGAGVDGTGEGMAEEELVEEFDVFRNVGQGLSGHYREIMIQYWQELINEIEQTNEPGSAHQDDFKSHSLPFARIRKVMKTDEEVRMISAEAPIIFAKACEIFITELTMRAWCISEKNKRRTLQKADIADALKQSDMFDFLIDIVPRAGITPGATSGTTATETTTANSIRE
ncbi:similar to Saccharomyces cerevisiae YOR358W HAP5 Subunit of the heme-activated [Maudiozyma barnettii]|uniref:Similar to Saccharomyces cerevisiae YOR358W HAP5 Subunit of the heme-activated n=1 Tax=Maudiozyma barnettii TaxID=61262 RepID=A0A8H2ZHU1_9SACH|nr:Hap5p [Kazachstania barnettii]CAB4254837.1 similar to Saccharomyces cerevisiae YOR358W HAP5 Subunit of the heme-activated [Kazachstania barnettii]CAD1783035.1 similar to Saccharomyces cerevisiae YOR358W HAP5 Subunit of the heme-activated [Kazachstania barnettii]